VARKCAVTGKSSKAYSKVVRRGKAKREGGVGKKTTGITRIRKYANLQRATVSVGGRRKKIWLSAKAMRMLDRDPERVARMLAEKGAI
jgi:large subunit ribosomal protein L28